jgi:hypothetical protein
LDVSGIHIKRDKRGFQGYNRTMVLKTMVSMEHNAQKTISVPEAGKRYFDLGRNASYEAARRGELPTIKIGRRIRVSILALERMLAEAGAGIVK